ncbi:MAG TPA: hypothetical protein VKH37_02055, partial [Ferruginibacter sp.]|nr:hypothetical protein [Ferruginibacter sp.]
MRKLFDIDDTIANKISYWHLVGFLVTLPFDMLYSELILASFTLHTIIHCRRSYLRVLFSRDVLILVSVFIIGALAILYSPDKNEGTHVATKQLAILIFPVLIALNGLDLKKYRRNLFIFFILSCTFAIGYLYVD